MSALLGTSSARRRGQTTLVSAVVAIGVVAGWLGYERWLYPRLMPRIFDLASNLFLNDFYLYSLVDAMVRYFAPYALVLLLWGRTGRRRLGAALCALATGLYWWTLWVVFDKWIWGDNASPGQVSAYEWATLLVLSAGLALAWGIARRRGRMWIVGLAAAPALAAVTRELALHSTWWRTHLLFDRHSSHDLTRQMVFIAPAVIAAVVCWLIEVVSKPRTSEPVPELVPETKATL